VDVGPLGATLLELVQDGGVAVTPGKIRRPVHVEMRNRVVVFRIRITSRRSGIGFP
jgi:hypothetical protein